MKANDSGKRKIYPSGATREPLPGKGRYDLISPFALKRLAIINEEGSKKYSDRNWEKGMPFSAFIDRVLRHIYAWMEGKHDEDHLGHAFWGLHSILHLEATKPECNDLPKYKNKPSVLEDTGTGTLIDYMDTSTTSKERFIIEQAKNK